MCGVFRGFGTETRGRVPCGGIRGLAVDVQENQNVEIKSDAIVNFTKNGYEGLVAVAVGVGCVLSSAWKAIFD